MDALRALVELPSVHLVGEPAGHVKVLAELLAAGVVVEARVRDARVAAICLAHGVAALWSAVRDFSWFPALEVVNPLVAG